MKKRNQSIKYSFIRLLTKDLHLEVFGKILHRIIQKWFIEKIRMQNFKVLYTKVKLTQLFHFSYGTNFGAEVLTVAPLDKSCRGPQQCNDGNK